MRPLQALLITDGRPGHYHLAEGILAAAARIRPIEVKRIHVRRPRWATGFILAHLVRFRPRPETVLERIYGLSGLDIPAADLVVSAGGDTLAANVAAARLIGAHNIFYGSLRRYRPEDFSLVLTSYARHAGRRRQVMTLKPSLIDPDDVPRLPARNDPADPERPTPPPRTAGLLIGGDSGTFRYSPTDWDRLIGFLWAMHRDHGTRWMISNSRRTPQALSDALTGLARQPESCIAQFIDVRTQGSETLLPLFAKSEAIVCTEDSSSMLSEAIWVRRPVIAVAPVSADLSPNERRYRDYLRDSGWTRSVPIAQLSPQAFLAALGEIEPIRDNPLDVLVEELKLHLPKLFSRI